MEQSSVYRQTIETFYKEGNIFERDQAYYNQMLTGTRRVANHLQGSARQSSLLQSRSRSNGRQTNISPPHRLQSSKNLLVQSNKALSGINVSQHQTAMLTEAVEQNKKLKREMDELLNGSHDFGNSSNVVIMQHYYKSEGEASIVREQEEKIKSLEQILASNEAKITKFKRGSGQLKARIQNIESLDKQIYKTLQGSNNKERQLLDKAVTALARGQRREDIAKILQQIILP